MLPVRRCLMPSRRIGAERSRNWLERAHPFGAARLADEDLSVDFGPLTSPGDRVALVATQPLTSGEPWVAMGAGELLVFDGLPRWSRVI